MKSTERFWHCGTLSYAFSGIVTLFFLLLLGDFAWSMKERSVFQIVQLLFKEYGASDTINGILIMSLPAALGMVLGPFFGYRSDRCRSRYGRRIPYLLFTTPIAAGAMAGMAFSPLLGGKIAEMIGWPVNSTILFLLGFFWTIFEFATVIANALFAALVNDVVPHEFLGRFYGLFRATSLLAGILFNYFLLGFAATHYEWLFAGIGVLYAAGFAVMCLKVKEGDYPPPAESVSPGRHFGVAREYFREAYSKPYYLLLFAVTAMAGVAMAPLNCYSLFYAQSLDVSMDHYGKAIAVIYAISLVLAWPLGWLADRVHPLRIAIATLFLYACSSFLGYAMVNGERTFLIFFITNIALAGIYITGSASLMQRLLPQGTFATLNSAGCVLGSLLYMLAVPLVGVMLDRSGHQYRYTFLLGGIFCLLTGLTGLIFYRQFQKHGGADHYAAP